MATAMYRGLQLLMLQRYQVETARSVARQGVCKSYTDSFAIKFNQLLHVFFNIFSLTQALVDDELEKDCSEADTETLTRRKGHCSGFHGIPTGKAGARWIEFPKLTGQTQSGRILACKLLNPDVVCGNPERRLPVVEGSSEWMIAAGRTTVQVVVEGLGQWSTYSLANSARNIWKKSDCRLEDFHVRL